MTPGDLLSLGAWLVLAGWLARAAWRWMLRWADRRIQRREFDWFLTHETDAGRWALEQDYCRGKCYPRPKERARGGGVGHEYDRAVVRPL